MTTKGKNQLELDRLLDAMAEDALEASDTEILEEFVNVRGDPIVYAAQMQARFQKTLLFSKKIRLRAAKAGLAAADQATPAVEVFDITKAREVLRRVLTSPIAAQLTLAARNESDLSDADVVGMLEDLRELGLWTPSAGNGELS